MRIEEALAGYLRSRPGVSALVGTRIYPLKAPQATEAAHVVYGLAGGLHSGGHDGPDGLRSGRISFACTARSYAGAKSVAEAVRAELGGLSATLSGLAVRIPVSYEDEDLYDDTVGLYVVVVDFELFWSG